MPHLGMQRGTESTELGWLPYSQDVSKDNRVQITERLTIVEGVLAALDSWAEVTDCIWNSSDRFTAREEIQTHFGFTETIANYVLDMQPSRTTAQARAQLYEEAVELRKQL